MSHTDEEFLGEDQEYRVLLDSDSNYTSRFAGEGRYIEDGAEDPSKSNIIKQVGKLFNFGALTSKKRGSASITKRGSSSRKSSTKKQQISGLVNNYYNICFQL